MKDFEKAVLHEGIDDQGDEFRMFPITTVECVEGLERIGGANLISNSENITIEGGANNNAYWIANSELEGDGAYYVLSIDKMNAIGTYFEECTMEFAHGEYDDISKMSTLEVYDNRAYVINTPGFRGPWELRIYAGIAGSTAGKTLKLTNVKLERGQIPTAWTPAFSDITDAIAQKADINHTHPGGILFVADFQNMTNVDMQDGVYNQAKGRIEASDGS